MSGTAAVNSSRQRAPLGKMRDAAGRRARRRRAAGSSGASARAVRAFDRPGREVLDPGAADLARGARRARGLGEEGGFGGVGLDEGGLRPGQDGEHQPGEGPPPSRDRRYAGRPPAGAPRAGRSRGCGGARYRPRCRARSGCAGAASASAAPHRPPGRSNVSRETLSAAAQASGVSGSGGGAGAADMAEQRDRGRRGDARDARRLAERRRPGAGELLGRLAGQPADRRVVEGRRQRQALVAAGGLDIGLLAGEIAGIAALDLDLPGGVGPDAGERGPDGGEPGEVDPGMAEQAGRRPPLAVLRDGDAVAAAARRARRRASPPARGPRRGGARGGRRRVRARARRSRRRGPWASAARRRCRPGAAGGTRRAR